MSKRTKCCWAGEDLELLADRALFWPRQKSLIIADPHFGKPSAFRNAGVPVPTGTTSNDLTRLTSLITEVKAEKLIVLGDFFHHRTGQCDRTMTMLGEWRRDRPQLDILIVMGNHDRNSDAPPADWNIRYEQHPVDESPFLYCHEPCRKADRFVLSGHIHPSIRLRDSTGHGLSLPCFLFSRDHALLPAFGGFTGSVPVRPKPGDQIFAIVEQEIMRIPTKQNV